MVKSPLVDGEAPNFDVNDVHAGEVPYFGLVQSALQVRILMVKTVKSLFFGW